MDYDKHIFEFDVCTVLNKTKMWVIWLVIFTIILVLLPQKIIKRVRINKLLKDIPSPPAVPYFGHVFYHKGRTAILESFVNLCLEYEGIVRLTAFWMDTILITSFNHTEELLSKTIFLEKGDDYQHLDKWLGQGLLTSGREKWRKSRKILTPAFHFQILEQFIKTFNSCTDILVSKLEREVGKESTDVYNYVTLCTLDVICESAMGTKVNAQINADSKYVKSVKQMSRILTGKIFEPLKMIPLFYYLSKDYNKEKTALKELHDYTTSVIQNRRKELINNKSKQNGVTTENKKQVFLDLLLQSSIDGRPMTDQEIREEVDTFMFEGHDTTSSAITSTLYCLAHNIDIQNKVFEETKEIFGSDKNRSPTYDDLQNMRYLEMVIKETLRLFPSVPFYGRKVVEDTKFGDILLPKGVSLIIFAWGMHRDPKLYPEPEKFDPERFNPQSQNQRNPFAYVPFSAGPRNCIGQRFAMLEMKATISKLLRNFEFLPVDNFKPTLVPDMVLKSLNGIELSIKNRNE